MPFTSMIFLLKFCFSIKLSQNLSSWWFQILFYFHPYLGKIPILNFDSYFQRGWNHQQVVEEATHLTLPGYQRTSSDLSLPALSGKPGEQLDKVV